MKIAATFLLAAFALTAQSPRTPPKSALDKATMEAYLRYAELWIPQVTVKIDDPKPSTKLDGFYDVNVHLTLQRRHQRRVLLRFERRQEYRKGRDL